MGEISPEWLREFGDKARECIEMAKREEIASVTARRHVFDITVPANRIDPFLRDVAGQYTVVAGDCVRSNGMTYRRFTLGCDHIGGRPYARHHWHHEIADQIVAA